MAVWWHATVDIEVHERDEFFEVVVRGHVTSERHAPTVYDDLPDGSRILVDLTGVTTIAIPEGRWAEIATRAQSRGLKIAIVATNPVAFGLSRQALLVAGVREGQTVAVFGVREPAQAWLVADDVDAWEFRGSGKGTFAWLS